MASNDQLSDEFNKMLDILLNPVRKKLQAEFRRAQKKALRQYLEFNEVFESVWVEHRQSLVKISFDGFMKSQKAGAMRQLRLFVDDKVITDDQRKEFFKVVETGFKSFAEFQAQESSEAMVSTSKDTVRELIEKYTEADQKKEINGIIDIIREARREAQERSVWRSIIGALAIVHGGANKGGFDSADETERRTGSIFEKVWITKQDSKVRDTHRPMQGVSIRKNELFEVPISGGGVDLMKHPGDRNATIGNWINCRCTVRLRKAKK